MYSKRHIFMEHPHHENPLAPAFTMSEGCKFQVTWNYIETPFKQHFRRAALTMCVI